MKTWAIMETHNANIDNYHFHKPQGDRLVKEVIFWIMVILGFIITLAVGMIIINWSLNAQI
jgi:hypothetical protein